MKRLYRLGPVILSGLLATCGGGSSGSSSSKHGDPLPVDSTKAALSIIDDLVALGDGAALASSFVGRTDAVMTHNESCSTVFTGSEPVTTCTKRAIDTGEHVHDGSRWLEDHIFNADHVSLALSTSTQVFYCVKSSELCHTDSLCNQTLTAVPVCFRVQGFAGGEFEIAVLVGAQQQLNPVNVSLTSSSLKIETKLAEVKSCYEAFADAADKTLSPGFPSKLEGRVTATVRRTSERVVSAQVDINDDITVEFYNGADEHYSQAKLAAATNMASVVIDGDSKQVRSHVDAKAMDLLVSAQNIFGRTGSNPRHVSGQLLTHLAGASGEAVFDASSLETIAAKHIGLGNDTTTVRYKQVTGTSDVLKVDLNPALGRHLDGKVTRGTDGSYTLSVSPGGDALAALDLNVISAQVADLVGARLKSVTEAKLTPSGATLYIPSSGNHPQVVSGTFELSASQVLGHADIDLVAERGMCLSHSGTPVEGAHPFSEISVGACPH